MQRRLLLNVVVGQRAPVLQLFARKNQALLIGRDALLVLNLRLHRLNGVRGLHLERDRFSGQRFHENLHGDTSVVAVRSEHCGVCL